MTNTVALFLGGLMFASLCALGIHAGNTERLALTENGYVECHIIGVEKVAWTKPELCIGIRPVPQQVAKAE